MRTVIAHANPYYYTSDTTNKKWTEFSGDLQGTLAIFWLWHSTCTSKAGTEQTVTGHQPSQAATPIRPLAGSGGARRGPVTSWHPLT